jgi:hypothetical protein
MSSTMSFLVAMWCCLFWCVLWIGHIIPVWNHDSPIWLRVTVFFYDVLIVRVPLMYHDVCSDCSCTLMHHDVCSDCSCASDVSWCLFWLFLYSDVSPFRCRSAGDLDIILSKKSAKEAANLEKFRTEGGSAIREHCQHLTKEDCMKWVALLSFPTYLGAMWHRTAMTSVQQIASKVHCRLFRTILLPFLLLPHDDNISSCYHMMIIFPLATTWWSYFLLLPHDDHISSGYHMMIIFPLATRWWSYFLK